MMDSIGFLQALIQLNSVNPPGNESRVTELFIQRCNKIGLPYEKMNLSHSRSNFLIHLKGRSSKKLMLCGHMDTVSPGEREWGYPPFSGEVVGNKIYGRGASDMKSGLAAMYLAIESLYLSKKVPPLDVVFLATAGEEVDSCGARHYLEHYSLENVEGIIIGEPTNEKIVVGHKGALWVEITTYGQTAHGSMPSNGVNAIEKMSKVIHLVEQLKLEWKLAAPFLGETSLAVTKIQGGIQTNVIPDKCTIEVDIRSVPPQTHEKLFNELKVQLANLQALDESFQADIKLLLDRSPILTNTASKIIQTAISLKGDGQKGCFGVSYYTDGAVLNPNSYIPTLIYGPGDEKLAHQPNEWVHTDAYLRSIEFYKNLILSM
ncbi:M20 family metallopeptidase [Bacillus timonensis]|nr:M20 family metallopeptidase [Bacillus timonensis]